VSDTPRTDYFWEEHIEGGSIAGWIDFSKRLERENQQLREMADRLAAELNRVGPLLGDVDQPFIDSALAAYQSLSRNAAETK